MGRAPTMPPYAPAVELEEDAMDVGADGGHEVIDVLDHGFVRLDGALADDLAVVNGARVSFGTRKEELDDRDRGLIGFLMRERHASPFEHATFRFHVKA